MDKNILTMILCVIIFYIVFLKINHSLHNKENNNHEIEIDIDEMDIEPEQFKNNSDNNIYNFYKNLSKNDPIEITKDNYDYDYETDFKYKNTPIIQEDFHQSKVYLHNNLNLKSQGAGSRKNEKTSTINTFGAPNTFEEASPNWIHTTMTGDPNFLVPNDLDANFIYSVPFPENTSIELAQFTAENVTDLFKSNNMEDLYNNINADVYRGYKTLKYML